MVRLFIEHETDWNVCGEAENGQMAMEHVQQSKPEVVILDLQMPVMNGLEAAREILRVAPNTIIAMLTLYIHTEVIKEAEMIGIRRVFSKSDPLTHLVGWLKTAVATRGAEQADSL